MGAALATDVKNLQAQGLKTIAICCGAHQIGAMSFLNPLPDFPIKPAHLALWGAFKAGVWAVVGAVWLIRGHFPWRTAAVGEVIAYAPIPIYLAWVGWTLYAQRKSARSVAEKPAATRPVTGPA
jgi:hypothetical protein